MQRQAEGELFACLLKSGIVPSDTPVIFILGSPRTGSTPFYQGVVRSLGLPYLSNLANSLFPRHPALAAPILRAAQGRFEIEFTSAYGKTNGAFQPSEASAVMRHWFGGEHPSQEKSTGILAGEEGHFLRTATAYFRVFGAPLVIKNAWNCFRIASLARLLPQAFFIWIRRDLVQSALSDLAARYVVQRDPQAWNSATPANVEALRKLPPWAQVVENQYEFARAMSAALGQHARRRHAEVWYEDFLTDPNMTLTCLTQAMREVHGFNPPAPLVLTRTARSPRPYPDSDEANLRRHVAEHADRFATLRYLTDSASRHTDAA